MSHLPLSLWWDITCRWPVFLNDIGLCDFAARSLLKEWQLATGWAKGHREEGVPGKASQGLLGHHCQSSGSAGVQWASRGRGERVIKYLSGPWTPAGPSCGRLWSSDGKWAVPFAGGELFVSDQLGGVSIVVSTQGYPTHVSLSIWVKPMCESIGTNHSDL